jgi:hypothetical protein
VGVAGGSKDIKNLKRAGGNRESNSGPLAICEVSFRLTGIDWHFSLSEYYTTKPLPQRTMRNRIIFFYKDLECILLNNLSNCLFISLHMGVSLCKSVAELSNAGIVLYRLNLSCLPRRTATSTMHPVGELTWRRGERSWKFYATLTVLCLARICICCMLDTKYC